MTSTFRCQENEPKRTQTASRFTRYPATSRIAKRPAHLTSPGRRKGDLRLNGGPSGFILIDMAGHTEQSEFSRGDVGQSDEVRAARAYGIDVSALVANVARSCSERVMRHQAALACVETLRKARRL